MRGARGAAHRLRCVRPPAHGLPPLPTPHHLQPVCGLRGADPAARAGRRPRGRAARGLPWNSAAGAVAVVVVGRRAEGAVLWCERWVLVAVLTPERGLSCADTDAPVRTRWSRWAAVSVLAQPDPQQQHIRPHPGSCVQPPAPLTRPSGLISSSPYPLLLLSPPSPCSSSPPARHSGRSWDDLQRRQHTDRSLRAADHNSSGESPRTLRQRVPALRASPSTTQASGEDGQRPELTWQERWRRSSQHSYANGGLRFWRRTR